MTEDFYDLLDIPSDASQDDIKDAFRTQVRIYHPDLNDDDRAQAQFTALKKAYDILGDPVERQAYDRLGHRDYVAKRTKGLPSPDLWQTDDGDADDGEASDSASETGTGESTEKTTAGAASTTAKTGGTGSSSSSTAGSATATGAEAEPEANTSATSGTKTTSATGSTDGGTTASTTTGGSAGTHTGTQTHQPAYERNAIVQWWHNRNFAWPLIWIAGLTYLLGLGHFALENESALRDLAIELRAIGGDLTALWETLQRSRHGIDTVTGFISSVELVAPPLPSMQWYGVLAGLVVCALLAVVGARVAWRRDTWGPITIDETIVVALALALASVLVGGPLLAGALLMPVLFGVIVYRTHQLPGWSPSYLFVLAVCTPLGALSVGAFGYATLSSDLLAYVVVPLLGAFGLPLRASVRKRLGR